MASLKREEEFRINHQKYKNLMRHFHTAFWMAVIPSGVVFVLMALYYGLRGLALLVGANFVLAQQIVNQELGTNDSSGLTFSVPYLYMFFLFAIAALSFIAFFFKMRKPHKYIFCIYAAGALTGLFGMISGKMGVLFGLYLVLYGIYGMWLQDYILRLHKDLDELALKDGFPDFIEAINEPHPMSNTSGLHYNRSEFLKREQRKKKENGEEADAVPPVTEMEELTMDTPIPKSSRKIDNMMYMKTGDEKLLLSETENMTELDPAVPVNRSKRRIDNMM